LDGLARAKAEISRGWDRGVDIVIGVIGRVLGFAAKLAGVGRLLRVAGIRAVGEAYEIVVVVVVGAGLEVGSRSSDGAL
jgi:hypothetical protein